MTRCVVLFVLMLALIANVFAIEEATNFRVPSSSGGGRDGGVLPDLFTGKLALSVPIELAPTRGGLNVPLSLAYGSGGGNDLCGVGWTLPFAYIERDSTRGVPVKWSATLPNALNEYENSNGFILNFFGKSSRLVKIGELSGGLGEYRCEIEGMFLQVFFYENQWLVRDKNGVVYSFGTSASARMRNSKTGWSTTASSGTFRWALDKVADLNGNVIRASYLLDSGWLYLSGVTLNESEKSPAIAPNQEVQFNYQTRYDKIITLRSGYRREMAKRLSDVVVKVNGESIRKYVLNYQDSVSTKRSLLSGVDLIGRGGVGLRSLYNFQYSQLEVGFTDPVAMEGVYTPNHNNTDKDWNSVYAGERSEAYYGYTGRSTLIDLDGDGLLDRLISQAPYNVYTAQKNVKSGFLPVDDNYLVGPVSSQGDTGPNWNSFQSSIQSSVDVTMVDINGDTIPDRIMTKKDSPAIYDTFVVQLGTGIIGQNSYFGSEMNWGPLLCDDGVESPVNKLSLESISYNGYYNYYTEHTLKDINGDGLPDRILMKRLSPSNVFRVQLNTGQGFENILRNWNGVDGQGSVRSWYSMEYNYEYESGKTAMLTAMMDVNGDGLLDRLLVDAYWNGFHVQYNNGSGFEPREVFGPVNLQGVNSKGFKSIGFTYSVTETLVYEQMYNFTYTDINICMQDINGDGLPDRIMQDATAPLESFFVQFNNGHGFESGLESFGPLSPSFTDLGSTSSNSKGKSPFTTHKSNVHVALVDINGDGLPDRVMRNNQPPYDRFLVQYNKGPLPDMLTLIVNEAGGNTAVTYKSSTDYDNSTLVSAGDPWNQGARSLLPFPLYVVSQINFYDGLSEPSEMKINYQGGMYDPYRKEFCGFAVVEVENSSGTKTKTYFHQGGGRDYVSLGEFSDAGAFYKRGMAFRTETIGSDNQLYSVRLNKIEGSEIFPGVAFPQLVCSIEADYSVSGNLRAKAITYDYDLNHGGVTNEVNLGEVYTMPGAFEMYAFFDQSYDAYTNTITYTNFPSVGVYGKMESYFIVEQSTGTLKKLSNFVYDQNTGNILEEWSYLDSTDQNCLLNKNVYDAYGNLTKVENAVPVATEFWYDSTQTLPVKTVTGTLVTNLFSVDVATGNTISQTGPNGLVVANTFDSYGRLIEVAESTNPFGLADQWKKRIAYNVGGILSGVSQNWQRIRLFDAVDPIDGHETYTYTDGFGRTVQTRVEAENSQFRVLDYYYDADGKLAFQTIPRLSTGAAYENMTGSVLGKYTSFDAIGRTSEIIDSVMATFDQYGVFQSLVETGGDAGSPMGTTRIGYDNGSFPWVVITTNALDQVKYEYKNAFGRTVRVDEILNGSATYTYYVHDCLGKLTRVIPPNAPNLFFTYDTLGRLIQAVDPSLGTRSYQYDTAGRLIDSVDAKGQRMVCEYDDLLGRLTAKQFFDASSNLVDEVTFYYDAANQPGYNVFLGQVAEVSDSSGIERFSYDFRGRMLKQNRTVNGLWQHPGYTTEWTYDAADRMQTVTYPSSITAKVRYDYDNAGHVTNVVSLAGTAGVEVPFYRATAFDAQGRVLQSQSGNGLSSSYEYYDNSMRLKTVKTTNPSSGWHQNLQYTYDKLANVKSITDGVYAGALSSTIESAEYDDLNRLTQVVHPYYGTNTFNYTQNGNLSYNGEDPTAATYVYGTNNPFAVLSANGKNYAYDANGSMTNRNGQTLGYDVQGRLAYAFGGGWESAVFAYDYSGNRIYKQGTNGYTVYIGKLFEERGRGAETPGQQLCHVFANGQLVATFAPSNWQSSSSQTGFFDFRMRDLPWGGILLLPPFILLCMMLSRLLGRLQRRRKEESVVYGAVGRAHIYPWWQRVCSIYLVIAMVFGQFLPSTVAQVSLPTLMYYHPDHLGSSTVVTDRYGDLAHRYVYSGFGRTWQKQSNVATDLTSRYTAQPFDEDTGLYYYGSRYYDPELARFTQADTIYPNIYDPQLNNPYSYVRNNPLNKVDPSGHSPIPSAASGGGYFMFMGMQVRTSRPMSFDQYYDNMLRRSGISVDRAAEENARRAESARIYNLSLAISQADAEDEAAKEFYFAATGILATAPGPIGATFATMEAVGYAVEGRNEEAAIASAGIAASLIGIKPLTAAAKIESTALRLESAVAKAEVFATKGQVHIYHGTTMSSAKSIMSNGFRGGVDSAVFFGEEFATARFFGESRIAETGARSGAVLRYTMPQSLAEELGLTTQHVLGEFRGAPPIDIPFTSGYERILSGGKIDAFNQAVNTGRISVKPMRIGN